MYKFSNKSIELQEKLSPKSKQIGNPVSDIVDSFYIAKAGLNLLNKDT